MKRCFQARSNQQDDPTLSTTVDKGTLTIGEIIEQLKAEQLAQFYFVIGLLLLKYDPNPNALSSSSVKNKMPTLTCLLKSSLLSKPNLPLFFNHEPKLSKKNLLLSEFLKFTHRESALRYSIIGNWLNFIVNKSFNGDQIDLAEQIKAYGLVQDVDLI